MKTVRGMILRLLPVARLCLLAGTLYLLLPATTGRTEPGSFSLGPLAGQHYRWDDSERWFVDQGRVTLSGALTARVGDFQAELPVLGARTLALGAVAYYGVPVADSAVFSQPIAGAGLSLETAARQSVVLAWAWETSQSIRLSEAHGLIVGYSFALGGTD